MITATPTTQRTARPVHAVRPAPRYRRGTYDPMLPAVAVAMAYSGAFANVERRLRGYPGLVARSLAGTQDFADAQRLLTASIDATIDAFRVGLIRPTALAPTYLQDHFDGWAMTRLQDASRENAGRFVTVEQMREIGQEFINQLCTTLMSCMAPAIAKSVLGENYLMRYYPIDKAIRRVEADLIRFCRDRSA